MSFPPYLRGNQKGARSFFTEGINIKSPSVEKPCDFDDAAQHTRVRALAVVDWTFPPCRKLHLGGLLWLATPLSFRFRGVAYRDSEDRRARNGETPRVVVTCFIHPCTPRVGSLNHLFIHPCLFGNESPDFI